MHSVTGRKGGGIIWGGKVKKETQQVACMIYRYFTSLTGRPRLEARNINLPEVSLELAHGLSCENQYGVAGSFGGRIDHTCYVWDFTLSV